MKTILAVVLCFVSALAIAAQSWGITGSANTIVIEVEGKTAQAISIATVQTPGNVRLVHDITATVNLGQAIEVVSLLTDRLPGEGTPQRAFPMTVTYLSSSGTITEERDYLNVSVSGLELPGFLARSSDTILVVIRMSALDMRTRTAGVTLSSGIQGKAKQVSQSAFAMSLEPLPSGRIDRISSMRFPGCPQSNCSSTTPFEIWVNEADAKPWHEWFEESVRDSNAGKDGEIVMLSADRRDVVATITLRDVRPTAYADETSAAGKKARVSLSARQVKLKFR